MLSKCTYIRKTFKKLGYSIINLSQNTSCVVVASMIYYTEVKQTDANFIVLLYSVLPTR